MPILSAFPDGGGNGGGGVALDAITNISTLVSAGKVFVKWTDPEDVIYDGNVLAEWSGTILVRKAGSPPVSRRDGKIIVDSKIKNDYQNDYFCDSGLANGVTYYYKLFPYTSDGTYTSLTENEFSATPTAQVMGIEDWYVTNMAASTEAGDGKIDITWTDPAANIVYEGTTLNSWVSTTVVVKEGDYATDKDDVDAAFVRKITTRNYHAVNPLTATGLTNGVTYYISFFPETDGGGINTSETQRVTGVANKITIATIPSQMGTLTYNGNSVSPSWNNYDSEKMTLSGTTLGMNAGNYTATLTPTADYRWSDGTTGTKEVVWKIVKAAGSLTLSDDNVELNPLTLSTTVSAEWIGDGVLSAESSDTSVVTVSVVGNDIIINSVNDTYGNVTVKVKVTEGTNHTAVEKNIAVKAAFVSYTLNDNSWETISQVSSLGNAANYWSVGDCKAVTVNGTVGMMAINGTYYAYIIGFNHNGTNNAIDFGTFKSAATNGVDLCLVDSGYGTTYKTGQKYFNMKHASDANAYGWKNCDMRYDILGSTDALGSDASATATTNPVANTLMAAMPSELRAVMKPMSVYTDNTAGGSNNAGNVTATVDYLPLLAEYEVYGVQYMANTSEYSKQSQYAYYSAGNSKMKYRHNATTSPAYWWMRSPYYGANQGFGLSYTNGNVYSYASSFSYGVAPIFRV